MTIISGSDGKTEILFDVADSVISKASKDNPGIKMPKQHKFAVSDIHHQHLAIFSHNKDDRVCSKTQPKLEGNVVQKGECRPMADGLYMNLKKHSFVTSAQPVRQVMTLDKAVVAFKPISVHKADIEFEQKKKSEGKKARDDKDKVVDVIMTAFQKHQYYALKDLAKITKQPIVSILHDLYAKPLINHYFNPLTAVLEGDSQRTLRI